MHITRPEALKKRLIVERAHARDVVRQRVDPDIEHVLGIVRPFDTPIKSGATDREVSKPRRDKRSHFVSPSIGLNAMRVRIVPLQKRLLILAEPEEIALLLNPFHLGARRLHMTVFDFGLVKKRFIGGGVPSRIRIEIDIAVGFHTIDDFGHNFGVIRIRRADKPVVGQLEFLKEPLETCRVLVREFFWRNPQFFRRTLNLETMLISAGQKENVCTSLPIMTRHRIRQNRGVGVTDMGLAVDVVNRGRDVEF